MATFNAGDMFTVNLGTDDRLTIDGAGSYACTLANGTTTTGTLTGRQYLGAFQQSATIVITATSGGSYSTSFQRDLTDHLEDHLGMATAGTNLTAHALEHAGMGLPYILSGLFGDGVTDDSAKINACIATLTPSASTPVTLKLPAGRSFALSSPIVLKSYMTLDISGCILVHAGTGDNIITNQAALSYQRQITDGALTAGSDILQSATANFTTADIGRSIQSNKGSTGNAGDAYLTNNKYFSGAIIAIVSSTQAQIDHKASDTVTGATVGIYNRDKNISIIGNNQTLVSRSILAPSDDSRLHSFVLRRIDGLTISAMSYQSTQAKYFIQINDATRVRISDIDFPTTNSDGVHLTGPLSDVIVESITGITGDDLVAVGCADYTKYSDTQGPVSDVTIRHIKTRGFSAGVALFGLANDPYHTMRDVRVDNVSGAYKNWLIRVESGNGDTLSVLDGITIDRVFPGLAQANTYPVIFLNGVLGDVTVRNLTDNGGTNAASVFVNANAQIQTLNVEGPARTTNSTSVAVVSTQSGSSVQNMALSDSKRLVFNSATAADMISLGGQVSNLSINGVKAQIHTNVKLVNCSVAQSALTATVSDLKCSNGTGAYLYWMQGTVDLQINNADHGPCYMAVAAKNAGTVVTVSGAAIKWSPTIFVDGVSSGVVRLKSLALEGEIDRPGIQKNNGDMAWNTKTALSCGAGPVVCNGTNWKNIYTGNTY